MASPSATQQLRSTHAEFTTDISDTLQQLRPKRPPTAPVDDLTRERQLILQGPRVDVLMIQIALFLAVLSLVSFVALDRDTAQGVTVLLLSTGVAIGFFLGK